MSGLEPLAALGLACNILQLVEFGRRSIGIIKTVYRGGKPDKELEDNAAVLQSLAEEVKKRSGAGQKKYEEILVKSANTCATSATELGEEVRLLVENAKERSLVSALRVAGRKIRRQRRLDKLKLKLDTEERRMQTGLLADIWSNIDEATIKLSGVRRDLRFFIQQYQKGRRETTELVSLEALETRKHITCEIEHTNKAVGLVGQKVDNLTKQEEAQVDERARTRLLQSLKFPEFNGRRNQITPAHDDTLNWVLVGDNDGTQPGTSSYGEATRVKRAKDPYEDSSYHIKWDSFSRWLSSPDGVYWISGKPGSGKTTLVKYILADKRTKKYLNNWSPGCEIASHFFWLPGVPMLRNMEGLLCSLLYQLLEDNSEALRVVMSSISGPKDHYTDWSRVELDLALLRTLDTFGNGVCLFLDGVDEIKPEDDTKDGIPEFLDWALQLSERSNIKVCLASRPAPRELERRLSKYPRLRMQDLNYRDLMAYAKDHVKFLDKYISADTHDPMGSLVQKSEGVFLWLILAIKSINEGIGNDDSTDVLQNRIDLLQPGLDALYRDMWTRASAKNPLKYHQTAALYFKLLLANNQQLDPFLVVLTTTCLADEVLQSLADPSKLAPEDTILQLCSEVMNKLSIYCVGLIECKSTPLLDGRSFSWYGHAYDRVMPIAFETKVEFIHRTARDFLTDTDFGRQILGFDTLSTFSIRCRLMKARMAKHALFTDILDRLGFSMELVLTFKVLEDDGDVALQDWERTVSACEQVADSGRLLAGDADSADLCSVSGVLGAIAMVNTDNEFVISRMKNEELSADAKSWILLCSVFGMVLQRPSSVLRTCREMLTAGADPNWQERLEAGPVFTVGDPTKDYMWVRSPWHQLLGWLIRIWLGRIQPDDYHGEWTPKDLILLAEMFLLFISEGAKLDDLVNIGWRQDSGIWKVASGSMPGFSMDLHHRGFFMAVPAHMLVSLMVHILRRYYSTFGNGLSLKLCDDLDNLCESHRTTGLCRVFGKYEQEPWEEGKTLFRWLEPTNEAQQRLGGKVMECLKGDRILSPPGIMSADDSEVKVTESGQTLASICDDDCWVEITRQGSGADIKERLQELGVIRSVARDVEMHPVGEWVRRHNQKNPQYSGTT